MDNNPVKTNSVTDLIMLSRKTPLLLCLFFYWLCFLQKGQYCPAGYK